MCNNGFSQSHYHSVATLASVFCSLSICVQEKYFTGCTSLNSNENKTKRKKQLANRCFYT